MHIDWFLIHKLFNCYPWHPTFILKQIRVLEKIVIYLYKTCRVNCIYCPQVWCLFDFSTTKFFKCNNLIPQSMFLFYVINEIFFFLFFFFVDTPYNQGPNQTKPVFNERESEGRGGVESNHPIQKSFKHVTL